MLYDKMIYIIKANFNKRRTLNWLWDDRCAIKNTTRCKVLLILSIL